LCHAADLLDPAVRLLDPLANDLAEPVASVPPRPPVDEEVLENRVADVTLSRIRDHSGPSFLGEVIVFVTFVDASN
jgi:hypothetical protein